MITRTDAENIILAMADMVMENRYLRKENERLSEELAVSEERLNGAYGDIQRDASNMLYGVLAMSYKKDGDMEKAKEFASLIKHKEDAKCQKE